MKRLTFFVAVLLFAYCGGSCSDCMDFAFEDDFCTDNYSVKNQAETVGFNEKWEFAEFSKIHAGHGTRGGSNFMTYSHPDKSPKVTGGTNAKGAIESIAVSDGMTFRCGLSEAEANIRTALILRKLLLEAGFDVLMIRDSDDVQLDNVARTVISNNCADIHIAIHFDGDGKKIDKGVFYCGIPDELKSLLKNVEKHSKESERLGSCIVDGLRQQGMKMYDSGRAEIDLTQTS